MKILKEKDLNFNDTTAEFKDVILYRIYLLIGIVGVPTILLGLYASIMLGVNGLGIANTLTFVPSLVVLLKYRSFPYKFKSNLIIGTMLTIAIVNLYVGAIFGAGLLVLLTSIGLATLLVDKKASYIWIALDSVVLILFAILFLNGNIILDVDFTKSSKSIPSWTVAILLFVWLGSIFSIAYSFLFKKLNKKIQQIQKNEHDLEIQNVSLTKLLKEKEEYNQQLIEAKEKVEENNRLKTEFLHNMSHEVRTPLNGIIGFTRLLNKDGITVEKRSHFSEIVLNSSYQLQKTIDNIIEISVLETSKPEVIFKELVLNKFLKEKHEVFVLSNTNKDLEIKLNSSNFVEGFKVNTDDYKLSKIIDNLIENAIKFTKSGYVEFGYNLDEKNIIFYVKDTGKGITKEKQEMVFNRFEQENAEISTKYGGMGLGLSIALANTKLLNGTILLESELNSGSTFFVKIPKL